MTAQEHEPKPRAIPDVSLKKAKTSIQDKWWLLAFLLHTAAYFGASAWINYAAITNDKLAVTDGTAGPIDT